MTSIWMVRSGHNFEYESQFLAESRIFLPIPQIQDLDLTEVETYGDIRSLVEALLDQGDELGPRELSDVVAEFCLRMERGDFVLMPLRGGQCVSIGRILSTYGYDSANPIPLRHLHEVEWITHNASSHGFYRDIKQTVDQGLMIRRITDIGVEKVIFSEIGRGMQPDRPDSKSAIEPPVSVDVTFDTRVDARKKPDAVRTEEPRQENAPMPISSAVHGNVVTHKIVDEAPSYQGDRLFTLQDEAISFGALLAIEHAIEHMGLHPLLASILQGQGFKVSSVDQSGVLLATKGELGLGPRVLLNVIPLHGMLRSEELRSCDALIKKHPADRYVLAVWQDELGVVEHQELVSLGWTIWNRAQILVHLLKNYRTLDRDIQSKLGLKATWTYQDS